MKTWLANKQSRLQIKTPPVGYSNTRSLESAIIRRPNSPGRLLPESVPPSSQQPTSHILTENSNALLTENGDNLTQE